MVGKGYPHGLLAAGGRDAGLEQLDDHAAEERLKFYRHFGAQLPVGGLVPELTAESPATRD